MQFFAWTEVNRSYGKVVGALLVTFLLFYLVAHALNGERGLYALFREQHHLQQLQAEMDVLMAKRKSLEHKEDMMRSSSLDPDLLDEQARRVLGMGGKGEMMIPLTKKESASQ